jgi:hypothetical protein
MRQGFERSPAAVPAVTYRPTVAIVFSHYKDLTSGIMVREVVIMRQTIAAGIILAALALSAVGQDWYHEREERFRGEQWRSHVFVHVRTDLEHVWSAVRASDKERRRLERTKEELTKMQADLDQGRFDNGLLNDAIDSIRKSSNDERLAPRNRQVLADDVVRLKDYQDHHNHWPH